MAKDVKAINAGDAVDGSSFSEMKQVEPLVVIIVIIVVIVIVVVIVVSNKNSSTRTNSNCSGNSNFCLLLGAKGLSKWK